MLRSNLSEMKLKSSCFRLVGLAYDLFRRSLQTFRNQHRNGKGKYSLVYTLVHFTLKSGFIVLLRMTAPLNELCILEIVLNKIGYVRKLLHYK